MENNTKHRGDDKQGLKKLKAHYLRLYSDGLMTRLYNSSNEAPESFHYGAAQWESLSGRVTAEECVGTGRDGAAPQSQEETRGGHTSTVPCATLHPCIFSSSLNNIRTSSLLHCQGKHAGL